MSVHDGLICDKSRIDRNVTNRLCYCFDGLLRGSPVWFAFAALHRAPLIIYFNPTWQSCVHSLRERIDRNKCPSHCCDRRSKPLANLYGVSYIFDVRLIRCCSKLLTKSERVHLEQCIRPFMSSPAKLLLSNRFPWIIFQKISLVRSW